MSLLHSYVPSATRVKLFGINVEGFGTTNLFEIERDAPATTFRKAMDGSHSAFIDKYGSYRINVYVMQSSEANTWLHLVFKAYQKFGADLKIPLEIEDKSGKLHFTSMDCFFETEPIVTRGSELGEVVWTFVCHNGAYNIAGNGSVDDLYDKLASIIRLIEIGGLIGIDFSDFTDKIMESADTAMTRLRTLV
ncbi:hypothetical protein Phab24_id008 [Acinetobacter phage Phab24]|nr:hypothetical protein Phab24_id008 [Acinetobacter phage Phab24]